MQEYVEWSEINNQF